MGIKDATKIIGRNYPEDKGTKHDAGKAPLSMIPGDALEDVARVFEYGAKKYGRNNYLQGMHWTRLLDASLRHLYAYIRGEDNDIESNLPHISHAACNMLMLLAYSKRSLGVDDRKDPK